MVEGRQHQTRPMFGRRAADVRNLGGRRREGDGAEAGNLLCPLVDLFNGGSLGGVTAILNRILHEL
jgi:hypothetical protein